MKKKSDYERFKDEQELFFEEEAIKIKERAAKLTEREVSDFLAKEGDAYRELVQDTKQMLIYERNIEKGIAGKLAETLLMNLLRENLEKRREASQE